MMIELSNTFVPLNVRRLRKLYHLSRRSMALLLAVTPKQLRMIEGRNTSTAVDYAIISRLLNVFNLSVETLFHSNQPLPKPEASAKVLPPIPLSHL